MPALLASFLAGPLSTLSPCVLPLIPVLLASGMQRHRLAPLALAGGLAASFTALGLDSAVIRHGAAAVMPDWLVALTVRL